MTCNKYLELLSARLDGALTKDEERELEAHLAGCPACRAVGAQLSALQSDFGELEDIEAPEGFARGVMDRIQAGEPPKVIPLFRRPQFRALAGLAACAVLAVGLYGAVQQQKRADADTSAGEVLLRGFSQDAQVEDLDTPEIAAYCDPGTPIGGTEEGSLYGVQKSAPEASTYDSVIAATPMVNTEVLTLDRMPEGAWDLIPPETPVSPDGLYVTEELFEKIEWLAQEEGITASVTTSEEVAEEFVIIVLEEME